jgi:hypothetical protein
MLSLIVSVHQPLTFVRYLEPCVIALADECRRRNEPEPELIVVRGTESMARNYNRGLRRARFALKAYVHEDMHFDGPEWAFRARALFAADANLALLGLVGGRVLPDRGYWWKPGRTENRVGGVLTTKFRSYWGGPALEREWAEVECVDGCVMITTADAEWDEAIPGFHCYDMDYCRTLRASGRRMGVFACPAWHLGSTHSPHDMQRSLDVYERKWQEQTAHA